MQISKISSQMTTVNNRQKTQKEKSDVSFGSIGQSLGKIVLSDSAMEFARSSKTNFAKFVDEMNHSKLHIDMKKVKPTDAFEPVSFTLQNGKKVYEFSGLSKAADSSSESNFKVFNSFMKDFKLEDLFKKFNSLEDLSENFKSNMVPRLKEKLETKVIPSIETTRKNVRKISSELDNLKEKSQVAAKENELAAEKLKLDNLIIRKNNLQKHINKNVYEKQQHKLFEAPKAQSQENHERYAKNNRESMLVDYRRTIKRENERNYLIRTSKLPVFDGFENSKYFTERTF